MKKIILKKLGYIFIMLFCVGMAVFLIPQVVINTLLGLGLLGIAYWIIIKKIIEE